VLTISIGEEIIGFFGVSLPLLSDAFDVVAWGGVLEFDTKFRFCIDIVD
jgi:hypothetical protein